ncbi:MAG: GNAT family acetyltransferase [Gammaproteobacteria bacterium]|nr:GNAT family acetyltransferase [Gammaproteobacteria bacterium]MDH3534400.1 GNAT family acetyltransferase [Gammaproteobacteria bacterium]
MQDPVIRNFEHGDEAGVIALWQRSGLIVPWNDPRADIERKCADSPDLFFVALTDGALIASCMAGYDGHRGWMYYLAVDDACRRQGIATMLVQYVEAELVKLGCPKIDLMVRNNNEGVSAFYRSIGYTPDPVTVLSKRLIEDEPHDFA